MSGRLPLLRGRDTGPVMAPHRCGLLHQTTIASKRLSGPFRGYSAPARNAPQVSSKSPRAYTSHCSRRGPRDKLIDRDFFFDVLNVSATRRDAKQYLSRFDTVSTPRQRTISPKPKNRSGVNLGRLYSPTAAVEKSPTFEQSEGTPTRPTTLPDEVLHLALVSIRTLDLVEEQDLDRIALTLSQLVRLDMRIVITFDTSTTSSQTSLSIRDHRTECEKHAERLIQYLDKHNRGGASYIDSSLGVTPSDSGLFSESRNLDLLLGAPVAEALKRQCIPIIPPITYTETMKAEPADRSAVMLALTKALSGVDSVNGTSPDASAAAALDLDRIIMIDPIGGIPSARREDGAHVFINMDQEYEDIVQELLPHATEQESAIKHHLETLRVLKKCLTILPPSTSALVISPEEAATSSRPADIGSEGSTIGTRRQKNPLIHNLLTNRPVISSSLPVARLSQPTLLHPADSTTITRSTLIKRGMPLKIIPDPRQDPWVAPPSGKTELRLDDHADINFPRLLALIEDSFRRPLDVQNYLARIEHKVAGVIIAGEYEGGAILTWESPAGSDGDPARLVPYLDKFAVLQKSQGNAGVADIVFQAMVRSCFPKGVCWRSRSDNPVNKWYFERSAGTWKLPDNKWTMFWTLAGEDLVLDHRRWRDYVAVCEGVVPTWADGKVAD